jgi:hypothetical protein
MSERSEFSPRPETSAERRVPSEAKLRRARHWGCPFLLTFLGKQKSKAGCGGAAPGAFLFLALVFLLLVTGQATAADLRTGGSFKSLDLYAQTSPQSDLPAGAISSNRLRLDLTGTAGAGTGFEFSAENQLLYTSSAGLFPIPVPSVNRVLDLEKTWNEGGRFQDQIFIDRLNLKGSVAGIDLTVGRQAIGFGRIVLFSPLDVIAPFPPDALDTDVRPGVDALRAVHYFGLGGQVGAVAVFGNRRRNHSYLGTFSSNVTGLDLLAISGWLRGRPMGGLGLAGSLAGLGLKGEIAAYGGRDVGTPGGDLRRTFAIGAFEGWYRFDNGLELLTEYLYNGPGETDPKRYPEVAASAPLREGLTYLLGRHYLMVGPSYQVHPLVKLEGLLIWNLSDNSFLLRPLADISLSDNLTLQLFWAWSEGKKPQLLPGPVGPLPRSEFGSLGDSGGAFLKYFF